VEVLSMSRVGRGRLKEVIAIIEGERVYSQMKYERRAPRAAGSGDRAQGRVHTSAITVAVLPEAEEVDIKIEAKDLRIDTFCSSGPGGQSVNTTYSAVRITHIPTGTVVSARTRSRRSRIATRACACCVRGSTSGDWTSRMRSGCQSGAKSMVGTGDRSEKIRTYNFPQNRMTDHRIGLTLHQLDLVMEGQLQRIVDALIAHYQAEQLKGEAGRAA
jgi:peptide chain release factor 1